MALQDFVADGIRERSGFLTQVPNYLIAGEDLAEGVFANIGAEGELFAAEAGGGATHLVKESVGKSTDLATISEGDKVTALTGFGRVRIPVKEGVSSGDYLQSDANGYAVKHDGTNKHVIGQALEDITLDDDGIGWGEAMVFLPSSPKS